MTTDSYDLPDLDAPGVEALRAGGALKWTTYGPDAIGAWVAEMDYPLAEPIATALHEAIGGGRVGYPQFDATSGVPEATSRWWANSYGVQLDPGYVHNTPDVLRGLELALHRYCAPGSGVVVTVPAYPPFLDVVPYAGHRVVEVPPVADGQGRAALDLDAIAAALRPGPLGRAATTVLLCHPYNPLGRAYDREEMLALADVVEAAGARVISDEIHAPLTYGRAHIPYASISDTAAAHTISLVSASKAFNLPGLKAAAVITHSDADERAWQELPYAATHGVSTLGLIATVAAYDHGKPWLDHVMAHLDGNRRLLADLIAEQLPGVGYVIPEATYLGWLDCRALPAEVSSSPVDFFLREAGVALNDGATFGNAGRGYVRLNFATPTPVLREIVERMGAAVSRL